MDWVRYGKAARRKAHYAFQKLTRIGFDAAFERTLALQAEAYLAGTALPREPVLRLRLDTLDLNDRARYVIARDDIYTRFVAEAGGPDRDSFGREGRWIPRGCVVYHDRQSDAYVKVFDAYFCKRGEGRFLPEALDAGFYDFLCPGLSFVIEDDEGRIRGYAIIAGEPITSYAFERYIGRSLRPVIMAETERAGLYLNDLEFHNVVRHGDRLSLIDLESVLPVDWFETDLAFARAHLDVVDIGWPIQHKWVSPRWYGAFVRALKARDQ